MTCGQRETIACTDGLQQIPNSGDHLSLEGPSPETGIWHRSDTWHDSQSLIWCWSDSQMLREAKVNAAVRARKIISQGTISPRSLISKKVDTVLRDRIMLETKKIRFGLPIFTSMNSRNKPFNIYRIYWEG